MILYCLNISNTFKTLHLYGDKLKSHNLLLDVGDDENFSHNLKSWNQSSNFTKAAAERLLCVCGKKKTNWCHVLHKPRIIMIRSAVLKQYSRVSPQPGCCRSPPPRRPQRCFCKSKFHVCELSPSLKEASAAWVKHTSQFLCHNKYLCGYCGRVEQSRWPAPLAISMWTTHTVIESPMRMKWNTFIHHTNVCCIIIGPRVSGFWAAWGWLLYSSVAEGPFQCVCVCAKSCADCTSCG